MPKYRVSMSDEEGLNGNSRDFMASNEEEAVALAREEFGPDFPVLVEVRPA